MKAGFLSALFLISLIAAPAIAAVPLPASVVVPDRGHDLFAAASMTRSQRNSSIPTDWGIFRRDGIGEWSLFGPRILGVAGLAYDPTNPQVLLLAAGDGVLRSEDRGRSWRQVTGWRISDVRSFAFDSGDPSRVYAATQWGPILSIDGGRSWVSSAAGLPVRYAQTLVADRRVPGRVLLGTESGLFVSENGAASWAPVDSPPVTILRVVQSASRPELFLAGTEGRGAWRSTDGGRSWQSLDPATASANLYAVAIRPDEANTLALGGWGVGVRISTDGGVTWASRGAGLPNQWVQVLAFDPDRPGRLWAAVREEGSYVSDDLGLTWQFAGLYGAYGHDYAFVPIVSR